MNGKSLRRTFAVPTLIALFSIIGLVSALIGDGVFDVLSWVALGVVVSTMVWAVLRRGNGR
jgi:hypothetical protein